MYELAASQWAMATGNTKPHLLRPASEWREAAEPQSDAQVEAHSGAHSGAPLPAVELTRARQQQLQWAAFASGVASLLEDSEQAERSRRRQWAAAAARDEHANLLQLLELSAQVELWTSRTQERLLPLAPHVWRTRAQVAVAARALWGGDIFVELYGSWAVITKTRTPTLTLTLTPALTLTLTLTL